MATGSGRKLYISRRSCAFVLLVILSASSLVGYLVGQHDIVSGVVGLMVSAGVVGVGAIVLRTCGKISCFWYSNTYSMLPIYQNSTQGADNDTAAICLTESGAFSQSRRDSSMEILAHSFQKKVDFVVNSIQSFYENDVSAAVAVVKVFTSIDHHDELSEFKLLVDRAIRKNTRDRGYGVKSLYHFVFECLDSLHQRVLLEHIDQIFSSQPVEKRRVIVLSDMDDTFVSTFKDRRFPWNTLYPGVQQFYHELIRLGGMSNSVEIEAGWNHVKDCVTFVTARPSWLHKWTRNELDRHGFETSVALTGSSMSFITPAQMLARKVKQCKGMNKLFPEHVFFLVGDNGQADIDLGKALLSQGLVRQVFIHDIFEPMGAGEPEVVRKRGHFEVRHPVDDQNLLDPLDRTPPTSPVGDPENHRLTKGLSLRKHSEGDLMLHVAQSVPSGYRMQECNDAGIILFQSYTGAALAAMRAGILSVQAMLNVANASACDFADIKFKTESQRQKQRDVFLRDIARISQVVPHASNYVEFLKSVHNKLEV
mmetsp:Transcript_3471/g.7464  ORF Transcript_3471/g.7464 Transcript_3471/m.7464 type:complete len:537 (-) Transcript_3471:6-1616(-)